MPTEIRLVHVESGKEIWTYNASHPSGTVIGRQVTMEEATQASLFGPSMSAPMIDATGNIWFVATAPDRERLRQVLDEIESRTGLAVLDLPMIEDYFINLGFPLQWA